MVYDVVKSFEVRMIDAALIEMLTSDPLWRTMRDFKLLLNGSNTRRHEGDELSSRSLANDTIRGEFVDSRKCIQEST